MKRFKNNFDNGKRSHKRRRSKLEAEVGRCRVLQGRARREQATEAASGVVVYAGTTGTAFGKQELIYRFAVVAQDRQFT